MGILIFEARMSLSPPELEEARRQAAARGMTLDQWLEEVIRQAIAHPPLPPPHPPTSASPSLPPPSP